jgi:hypothetical protein
MRYLIVILALSLLGCSDKETKLYTPLIPGWFVKKLEDGCVEALHGKVNSGESRVEITNRRRADGKEGFSIRAIVKCEIENGITAEVSDNYGGGSGMQYDVSKETK